jgi:hypothetical protein
MALREGHWSKTARRLLPVLACATLSACASSSQGTTDNLLVSITAEPPGAHCAAGGQAIEWATDANGDGVLAPTDVTTTAYVCNGTPGAAGGAGAAGQSVAVTSEPAGSNCANGGAKLQVGSGPATYVCKGANGADGQSVTITSESAGSHCTYGGQALQVGSGTVSYVCSGAPGAAGGAGADGQSVAVTSEPAGSNCAYGGAKLQVGSGSATYVCNGAPGGGLPWTQITSDTQAEANHGYIANSPTQLDITMPVSSGLSIGDLVDANGLGAGGFRMLANVGQEIAFGDGVTALAGSVWTAGDTSRQWRGVASSSDGSKLVAASYYDHLYTSVDSGATWTARDSLRDWRAVASSSDGSKLVAVAYGDQIYTSADSGATWTARDASRTWTAVASSSDGSKLVAADEEGGLYTSVPPTAFASELVGLRGASASLLYAGTDTFSLLDGFGTLFAY